MTNNENNNDNTLKIMGFIIPKIPGLAIRLSGTLIRFKSQANKAGKVFEKELISQGLDKKTAEDLKSIYLEGSQIRNYINIMR